jgi:hypothetical protein
MKHGWMVSEAEVAVVVRGPRGETIDGRIVRFRESRITLAIGVGRARSWQLGDRVAIDPARRTSGRTGTDGRVYSIFRAMGADYVIVDLLAPVVASRLGGSLPRDRRVAARSPARPSSPILAIGVFGTQVVVLFGVPGSRLKFATPAPIVQHRATHHGSLLPRSGSVRQDDSQPFDLETPA